MKYRIAHAYPRGYMIQQSTFGLFWENALIITEGEKKGERWSTLNLAECENALKRLRLYGKPLKKNEITEGYQPLPMDRDSVPPGAE